MWSAIKSIVSVVLLIGIVVAIASTIFIFSWVFKIIGFLLAVGAVFTLLCWIVWEIASGWWEDRRSSKKKAPK